MGVLHDIVRTFCPTGVAREPPSLLELVEAVGATGQDLMHIGLMPGVPYNSVLGRIEDPVQGDGELNNAEIGSKVPSGGRHLGHQEIPDLTGQQRQLLNTRPLSGLCFSSVAAAPFP